MRTAALHALCLLLIRGQLSLWLELFTREATIKIRICCNFKSRMWHQTASDFTKTGMQMVPQLLQLFVLFTSYLKYQSRYASAEEFGKSSCAVCEEMGLNRHKQVRNNKQRTHSMPIIKELSRLHYNKGMIMWIMLFIPFTHAVEITHLVTVTTALQWTI